MMETIGLVPALVITILVIAIAFGTAFTIQYISKKDIEAMMKKNTYQDISAPKDYVSELEKEERFENTKKKHTIQIDINKKEYLTIRYYNKAKKKGVVLYITNINTGETLAKTFISVQDVEDYVRISHLSESKAPQPRY